MKIGHAHLKVRSLERSVEFYRNVFGLQVREQIGGFAFLSGTEMYHEIALQEVGEAARLPGRSDVGLFHVAFEVPDRDALSERYHYLLSQGMRVFPVDHRISLAIYFSDPDGNGLEIYCDTRDEADGAEIWEGRDRRLVEL
ncbi:MAG: VOC family protein [Ignavibacteriae bacterium]|nr:VOC family protein [Ignavibacteriota bacterium]MCB9214439.1 VOC family protein [Ignavibacteria bacterium]